MSKVIVTAKRGNQTHKAKISIPKDGIVYIVGNFSVLYGSCPLGFYDKPRQIGYLLNNEKEIQITRHGIRYPLHVINSRDMRILLILVRNHLSGKMAPLKNIMKFIWLHIKKSPIVNHGLIIEIANVRREGIFDYSATNVTFSGKGNWIQGEYHRTLEIDGEDTIIRC